MLAIRSKMAKVKSRFQVQRTLSDAPDEIPHEANQLYDHTDDKCCSCLQSCISSEEEEGTYTQIPEEPDEISDILIRNRNSEEPDYHFEAHLETTKVEYDEEPSDYERHILTDVQADGAADQMKIKDGDEIVLINDDTFAPGIGHDAVLQIFRDIKIDGQSTFKMVIRRKKPQGCCGSTNWKWVELTSTFSLKREIGEHPIIVATKSQQLWKRKKQLQDVSLNLYKVPGTQRYITIDNGTISSGILEEDENETKHLWKHSIIKEARGRVYYNVALSDHTRTWYIAVDRRGTISLKRNPLWYLYTRRGSYAIFKTKHGYYLAYDDMNEQLRTQTREYVLEEIPGWTRNRKF